MTEINENNSKFDWFYKIGFYVILSLPILLFTPWFFPADWGKNIVFRSIMAIMLFLLLWQAIYRRNEISLPNLKNNPIILSLAGLLGTFLLATLFSVDPLFSLWGSPYRGGGFVNFAFYILFAILSFILLKKNDWSKTLNFSIIIGSLVSLLAVAQFNGLFNLSVIERPYSTMGNPIILGIYLLLLFFITLSLAIKNKVLWKKVLYFIALALFSYVVLITGARAVYLGLTVGIVYFLLFYPKKSIILKIVPVALLIAGALFVFYVNTTPNLPKIFEENKILKSITYRFSTNLLATDPRFASWQVSLNAINSKPILGYGPENFSVGFDKNFNPSIPYLDIKEVGWWDRAHNVLLDVATTAGIPALIIYLALFITLFWQLQKKKTDSHGLETDLRGLQNNQRESAIISENPRLMAHGVQTTLLAYFVANFFSFDTFSTYLLFFLLIGYTLHLIKTNSAIGAKQIDNNSEIKFKKFIVPVALILLVIFLWQYNFVPLQINADINTANQLANQKNCSKALSLMDKALTKHSFLDSYIRMEYVELTKTCSNFYPENNKVYLEKGIELIKEAAKIQPLYTRYWIYLGSSTTSLAVIETNAETKNNLLNQANEYFSQALKLAPKHQEITIGQAKNKIVAQDYNSAKKYSEQCVVLNANYGECYFYLAISNIYLNESSSAKNNLELANTKGFYTDSKINLGELSDAYGYLKDYKNLATVYEKLIALEPAVAQYHSSLAFFYKELGEYSKARQEALKVLEISPQSKPNVDAFLKTLP